MTEELELAGRRVLVCGGDAAAVPLITRLHDRGAVITVLAESVAILVAELAERRVLDVVQRRHTTDDLEQAALVVAAAGTQSGDAEIAAAAGMLNRPVIRATGAAQPQSREGGGRVILVGGGPGSPDLLTIGGLAAIRSADVLVCDRLAPLGALAEARPGAMIIDVAKIPRGPATSQEQINELLVRHARAGRLVVRLKGGDSFVFGRGGEEWQACAAAGVPVEVIPGVTSAVAGPALVGIPLTHRTLTQGFTVVSGHVPPDDPGSALDWSALARANTTLVIMMGLATLPKITAELLAHGLSGDTPAATVASAGLPAQQTLRGSLADIAVRTRDAGIRPPAITVIGAVAAFEP